MLLYLALTQETCTRVIGVSSFMALRLAINNFLGNIYVYINRWLDHQLLEVMTHTN